MHQLTQKEFRNVTLGGAALGMIGNCLEWFNVFIPSREVQRLLEWNYYNALASFELYGQSPSIAKYPISSAH